MRFQSLLAVFIIALVVELAIVTRGFGLGAPWSHAFQPAGAAGSESHPLLGMGTTGRHDTDENVPAALDRVPPGSQRVNRLRDVPTLCDHAAASLPVNGARDSLCAGTPGVRMGIAGEQDSQPRGSSGTEEIKTAPDAPASQRIAGSLEPATVNRYAKREGRGSTLYRVTTGDGTLMCGDCHARASGRGWVSLRQ